MLIQTFVFIIFLVSVHSQSNPLMFPYGPDAGDSTLPRQSDSVAHITLSKPIYFFDQINTELYVDSHGAIWPGWFCGELCDTPTRFPVNPGKQVLACFWTDADLSANSYANVYYRVVGDFSTMLTANSLVQKAYGANGVLDATSDSVVMVIATWVNITYRNGNRRTQTNTFQCAMVSDGKNSYALFAYADIQWMNSPAEMQGNNPGIAGMDSGYTDPAYNNFSLPFSHTASVNNLLGMTNFAQRGPNGWFSVSLTKPYIPFTYNLTGVSYATCQAITDPHYFTFDGLTLDNSFDCAVSNLPDSSCSVTAWQPPGKYIMVGMSECHPSNFPRFSIILIVDQCTIGDPSPNPINCPNGIIINFFFNETGIGEVGTNLVVGLYSDHATVNDENVPSVYPCPIHICSTSTNDFTFSINPFSNDYGPGFIVTTNFGLNVTYVTGAVATQGYAEITMPLVDALKGNLFGYCGNMDDDQYNDNFCWNPALWNNNDYQYCWPESYLDPTITTGIYACQNYTPIVNNRQKRERKSMDLSDFPDQVLDQCAVLIDPNGVFAKCQSISDFHYTTCLMDMSITNVNEDMFCTIASQFSRQCLNLPNVTSLDWRSETFCPLDCQENAHYSPGGPSCVVTCDNPFATTFCTGPAAQGCVCDEGFVAEGSSCIDISQCGGCLNDIGTLVANNTQWITNDCSKICTCNGNGDVSCDSKPCSSNAECINDKTAHACSCNAGYFGDGYICTAIDECLENQCQHNAKCVSQINDYKCVCTPAYTGQFCQQAVDFCAASPCVQGNCSSFVGGYNCTCVSGYIGNNCEQKINWCASFPCMNKATCVSLDLDYQCLCQPMTTGRNCETTYTTTAATTTKWVTSSSFNCESLPNGDYADPNNPCSQNYFTCSNGDTYDGQCPSGLYFNQDDDKCQEYSLVPACFSSFT